MQEDNIYTAGQLGLDVALEESEKSKLRNDKSRRFDPKPPDIKLPEEPTRYVKIWEHAQEIVDTVSKIKPRGDIASLCTIRLDEHNELDDLAKLAVWYLVSSELKDFTFRVRRSAIGAKALGAVIAPVSIGFGIGILLAVVALPLGGPALSVGVFLGSSGLGCVLSRPIVRLVTSFYAKEALAAVRTVSKYCSRRVGWMAHLDKSKLRAIKIDFGEKFQKTWKTEEIQREELEEFSDGFLASHWDGGVHSIPKTKNPNVAKKVGDKKMYALSALQEGESGNAIRFRLASRILEIADTGTDRYFGERNAHLVLLSNRIAEEVRKLPAWVADISSRDTLPPEWYFDRKSAEELTKRQAESIKGVSGTEAGVEMGELNTAPGSSRVKSVSLESPNFLERYQNAGLAIDRSEVQLAKDVELNSKGRSKDKSYSLVHARKATAPSNLVSEWGSGNTTRLNTGLFVASTPTLNDSQSKLDMGLEPKPKKPRKSKKSKKAKKSGLALQSRAELGRQSRGMGSDW